MNQSEQIKLLKALVERGEQLRASATLVRGVKKPTLWNGQGPEVVLPDTWKISRPDVVQWKTSCATRLHLIMPRGHILSGLSQYFQNAPATYGTLINGISKLKALLDDAEHGLLSNENIEVELTRVEPIVSPQTTAQEADAPAVDGLTIDTTVAAGVQASLSSDCESDESNTKSETAKESYTRFLGFPLSTIGEREIATHYVRSRSSRRTIVIGVGLVLAAAAGLGFCAIQILSLFSGNGSGPVLPPPPKGVSIKPLGSFETRGREKFQSILITSEAAVDEVESYLRTRLLVSQSVECLRPSSSTSPDVIAQCRFWGDVRADQSNADDPPHDVRQFSVQRSSTVNWNKIKDLISISQSVEIVAVLTKDDKTELELRIYNAVRADDTNR